MKHTYAMLTSLALILAGCQDQKAVTELKQELKDQREAQRDAQKASDAHMQETSKKVNELLIRNETMLRQLDRFSALETKLSELEQKRLEELKEAAKPRNTTVESAIESGLKLTTLTDPKIRMLVCPLLSRLGGKLAEERLLELVKSDRDPNVRNEALKGLVEMNSQQVIPVLNEALLISEGDTLEVVSKHMSAHCDETSRTPALAVLHTLKDFENDYKQRSIRQNLYQVLGKVGKPEDVNALKPFFEREKEKERVMSMLLQIDSKQALSILHNTIGTASDTQARALAKYLEKYANDSSRQPILTALDNLITSDEYNAREARKYLYKTLTKIAKPEDNEQIERLLKLENGNRNELVELYVATGTNRKAAVFKQLERAADSRYELSRGMFKHLQALVDIRATNFLTKYLTKHNDYYTSPMIIGMLVELKDPMAAKTLVTWFKKGRHDKSQRLLLSAFLDGYPGVTYDEASKKATLVSDEAMKELMAKRAERLIKLETGKPATTKAVSTKEDAQLKSTTGQEK
jgi:HEAT repeat protein